jgi:hypothetical protein
MRELEMDCRMQSELDRSFVHLFFEVARVEVLGFAIADVGAAVVVTAGISHWAL